MKYLYLFCLFSLPASLLGSNVEDLKFFENHVRPLLAAECYKCHGPEKVKGGLRLDHISHITKGGDTGPALVAGDVDGSLLIEAVRGTDPDFVMPPKKKLDDKQVAILEKWISAGAVWPEEVPESGDIDEFGFTKEDYQWWAVQPVGDPAPPENGKEWAKNEIDYFVARKLDDAGLQPAPEASRFELVRRAYLDLHGLPPTSEQIAAFVDDKSPDAWGRLIDRLLDDPAYGERWAQHWLDVVRYAESDGYRADGYRPESWRYRDYVIRSLNEDKPYDQFVREQLAGDEIAPDDPNTLVATGFLRLGIYEWNQRNARMHWDLIMTEMTNATAEAFLGIGIGCAQCHDHKFDPILQKDHFALQAFLNSVWWPEHHLLGNKEQLAQQEKWEAATADVRARMDELKKSRRESHIRGVVKQFPEDIQEIYHKPASERDAYEEQLAQLVQRQVDHKARGVDWKKEFAKDKKKLAAYTELEAELAKFNHLKPKEKIPYGFISTDAKPEPTDTLLKKRGKADVVEPAFLTLLGQPAPKIEPAAHTTGRRSVLADWIADSENPLSTRVIVNRLWQNHFAKGLAPSPNDFGKLGGKPTHPELLDWLTSRFLENGWKLKSMHKLIMSSATYRQTAQIEPTSVERMKDPGNDLLWRYPPKRLQAEQLRDAMLAVAGEMSSKYGGPSQSAKSTSRSIYTQKKRNSPDAFLGGFDAPAGFSSTPNRIPTTTPNQSLLLVNGSWVIDRSRAFAKRVLNGRTSVDESMIHSAFQLAYGRPATNDEVAASIDFIQSQTGEISGPESPAPKYPGENGLRDISNRFSKVKDIDLGSKALWLQPGSRFQQLDFSKVNLPTDAFTIEAVADLDTVYKDASVNTLVSQWNGSQNSNGWSLGVTSEKSAYQPRNFIMQLVGKNFQDNQIYEVVASDLRFPLRTPVYFAASVSAVPTDGDATSGKVTFYLRDLTDSSGKLQVSEVKHSVTGGLSAKNLKSFIGGRNGKGHLWDGQLARLKISDGALSRDELLIHNGTSKAIVDWDFSSKNGEEPAPATAWYRKALQQKQDSRLLSATTDFCHALLNSNEFIYLH